MSRFHSLHRGRKVRRALLTAVVSVVMAAALVSPAAAAPPIGPVPTTTNNVTLTTSAVTGLSDGSAVTFTVNTAGATKLVGSLTAHLCIVGSTVVHQCDIRLQRRVGEPVRLQRQHRLGWADRPDYEDIYGPYRGDGVHFRFARRSTSATGSLVWATSPVRPFTLTADSTHSVDLVIEVTWRATAPRDVLHPTVDVRRSVGSARPADGHGRDAGRRDRRTSVDGSGQHRKRHYRPLRGHRDPDERPRPDDAHVRRGYRVVRQRPAAELLHLLDHRARPHQRRAQPDERGVDAGGERQPAAPWPTGVSGTGGSSQVNVSWTAPVVAGRTHAVRGHRDRWSDARRRPHRQHAATSFAFTGLTTARRTPSSSGPTTARAAGPFGSPRTLRRRWFPRTSRSTSSFRSRDRRAHSCSPSV